MLPPLRSWPDELSVDPLVGDLQDDPELDDDPELPIFPLLRSWPDELLLPMLLSRVDAMLPLCELRSRPCWSELLLP
jgi:hypothetical protein